MRLGSKGLDAPTIIGIIVAVAAAVLILYLLWIKGMLPFSTGVTETECTSYFIRECQSGQVFGDGFKNSACKSFAESAQFGGKNPADNCIYTVGGQKNCDDFCTKVLSSS